MQAKTAQRVLQWSTPMDWSQVRALFPAAERYTYLNTAAAPPLSLVAAREGKHYYDEMAEHAEVAWDRWVCQVEDVRVGSASSRGTSCKETLMSSIEWSVQTTIFHAALNNLDCSWS